MLNSLRVFRLGRWVLALALAAGYCCAGGCWHHDHDGDGHGDDHRDFHDDHHDHDHN
jgi:hypothetical protein